VAGGNKVFFTGFAAKVASFDVEMFGTDRNEVSGGNFLFIAGIGGGGGRVDNLIDKVDVDVGGFVSKGLNNDFLKTTFDIADVGDDILSEKGGSGRIEINPLLLSFLIDNSDTHFVIGKLDIDSETTHKAGDKAIFETIDVGGLSI